MMIQRKAALTRRGGVLVEIALVMVLMTTFVFGIFEYSRLMMDWNLLKNAAREGCRYAIANNTSTTISTSVQTIVTKYMAGENASFTGFTVAVSGTHNGVSTAVNNLTAGDMLTVTVSGTYNFMNIVPLVHMPTAFTISSAVAMICEGGT
jgi:Flp pilus assembly protein TadG